MAGMVTLRLADYRRCDYALARLGRIRLLPPMLQVALTTATTVVNLGGRGGFFHDDRSIFR